MSLVGAMLSFVLAAIACGRASGFAAIRLGVTAATRNPGPVLAPWMATVAFRTVPTGLVALPRALTIAVARVRVLVFIGWLTAASHAVAATAFGFRAPPRVDPST